MYRYTEDVVGISKNDQDSVMRVVAGILHLGNVEFKPNEDDDDGCNVADEASKASLADAVGLFTLNSADP